MSKFFKSLLKYILEFIVVAFGVFLGIYISEMRSEERLDKEKDKALSFILEELQTNIDNIRASADYHRSMRQSIDSIKKSVPEKDIRQYYIGNTYFMHNKLSGWNGVRIPEIEHTALESAQLSGILKEFELEKIRAISKIYNRMDMYYDFSYRVLSRLIDMGSDTRIIDVLIILDIMTTDIANYESSLITDLNRTIDILQPDLNKASSDTED